MQIIRKVSKVKDVIYVDGKMARWATVERQPDNTWQVRYQLFLTPNAPSGSQETVTTQYFTTAFPPRKTPKGRKEITEFYQPVEKQSADWIWERQKKRGVIV